MTPDVGSANNFPYSSMLANCMPGLASVSTGNKTTMDDVRGFKFYLARACPHLTGPNSGLSSS